MDECKIGYKLVFSWPEGIADFDINKKIVEKRLAMQHLYLVALRIEGIILPDPSRWMKQKGLPAWRTNKARIIYMAEMRGDKTVPVDFIRNAGAESNIELTKAKSFDYEIGKILEEKNMNWANRKGIYFFDTAEYAAEYYFALIGIAPNKEKEKRNGTGNQ